MFLLAATLSLLLTRGLQSYASSEQCRLHLSREDIEDILLKPPHGIPPVSAEAVPALSHAIEKAWKTLAYRAEAVSKLSERTRDFLTPEGVLQDFLIHLWKAAHHFDPNHERASAEGWVNMVQMRFFQRIEHQLRSQGEVEQLPLDPRSIIAPELPLTQTDSLLQEQWFRLGYSNLSTRERVVIDQFLNGVDRLVEIGQHMSITRERVRQIRNDALAKFRDAYDSIEGDSAIKGKWLDLLLRQRKHLTPDSFRLDMIFRLIYAESSQYWDVRDRILVDTYGVGVLKNEIRQFEWPLNMILWFSLVKPKFPDEVAQVGHWKEPQVRLIQRRAVRILGERVRILRP